MLQPTVLGTAASFVPPTHTAALVTIAGIAIVGDRLRADETVADKFGGLFSFFPPLKVAKPTAASARREYQRSLGYARARGRQQYRTGLYFLGNILGNVVGPMLLKATTRTGSLNCPVIKSLMMVSRSVRSISVSPYTVPYLNRSITS
jgi:hypothetical protein